MPSGALYTQLTYPGHFGLWVPSQYLFHVEGKMVILSIVQKTSPVEVLDSGNQMIPNPDDPSRFTMKSPIPPPSKEGGKDFTVATIPISIHGLTDTLETLRTKKATDMPHRLTLDTLEDEYRIYQTTQWTSILIQHEIENPEAVSDEEKQFFHRTLNRFIQAYKYISGDPRITFFYLDQITNPVLVYRGSVKYSQDEEQLAPDARLGKERLVDFKELSISFRYGQEGKYEVDPAIATAKVKEFLSGNRALSLPREILLRAHTDAFHTNNYKTALLDAFTAIEIGLSTVLESWKLVRGVSKTKLKNYKDEVGIAYKLNIDLPMLLEQVTDIERQVIGRANKVRDLRNDVVHEGRSVSKEEAQEAVNTSKALFDLLTARGITV